MYGERKVIRRKSRPLWWLRFREWFLLAQAADKESLVADHIAGLDMLYTELRRVQTAISMRESPRKLIDHEIERNVSRT